MLKFSLTLSEMGQVGLLGYCYNVDSFCSRQNLISLKKIKRNWKLLKLKWKVSSVQHSIFT